MVDFGKNRWKKNRRFGEKEVYCPYCFEVLCFIPWVEILDERNLDIKRINLDLEGVILSIHRTVGEKSGL